MIGVTGGEVGEMGERYEKERGDVSEEVNEGVDEMMKEIGFYKKNVN